MKIQSDFVGTRLKPHFCTVSARWTMNYAASINDPNPLYFNDERAGGIIAPPLFPVAVTWPVIEKLGDYIEARSFPREVMFTQVHYTEHLAIVRPVMPGDRLTVNGSVAAIIPHRAGTHVVIRFDAVNNDSEPVFTEHIGAMLRGVECADGGRGGEDLPVLARNVELEKTVWESSIFIHPLSPYLYDGCSTIHFPIHTSVKFARQVGLPGIIQQGTATLALAAREIIDREAAGKPTMVDAISCRFTGMVLPGSDITVRLTGKQKSPGGTDCFFIVLNTQGKKAVSDGHIRLKP